MEDSALAAAAADLAIIPTIIEEEEEETYPRGRRLEASEYAAMQHIQELMVEVRGWVGGWCEWSASNEWIDEWGLKYRTHTGEAGGGGRGGGCVRQALAHRPILRPAAQAGACVHACV